VHEQIHFDIAELVIRQMRKKFMNHRFRSLDGVNKMINSTFAEAAKEHVRLNEAYDKETDHSRNKPKQLLWEDRIQRELKTLNDYSSTRVTITK
jgi:predicted secreted Zn-dependent protease